MFYYDIHNIVKIESNVNLLLPSIFKIEKCTEPDLKVHIGDFQIENEDSMDKKYYYKRSLGPIDSKFLISNLMGRTRICYKSPRYSFQPRIRKSLDNIILSVISWKLLAKKHTFIYGACIEKAGEGYLLFAPSGFGKTSTVISLTKENDFKFISDDTLIIDQKKIAYSYPMDLKIRSKHIENSIVNLKSKRIIEMYLRRMLRKIPFIDGSISEFCVNILEILNEEDLAKKVEVKSVFLLEKGEDEIKIVDSDEILTKMLNYNYYTVASGPSIFSLYLYLFHNPEIFIGDLLTIRDDIIRKLLADSDCFIVRSNNYKYAKLLQEHLS